MTLTSEEMRLSKYKLVIRGNFLKLRCRSSMAFSMKVSSKCNNLYVARSLVGLVATKSMYSLHLNCAA